HLVGEVIDPVIVGDRDRIGRGADDVGAGQQGQGDGFVALAEQGIVDGIDEQVGGRLPGGEGDGGGDGEIVDPVGGRAGDREVTG
ncbi:MAG: hypothetical protein AAF492_33585, partial [Verrucomicrobiota bacterium]